jgi:hypothetical protein
MFRADDITGYVFYGHGEQGSLVGYGYPGDRAAGKVPPDQVEAFFDMYYVAPAEVSVNYKLSFLYLFACQAGQAPWDQFVSENGEYYAPPGSINVLTPWLPHPLD